MKQSQSSSVMTQRQFVRQAMDALNLDATNLARRAKLSASTLTRLMNNEQATALRSTTLEAIARASGVPLPAELQTDDILSGAAPDAGRDLPIHTLMEAPIVEGFYWSQHVVDHARRPPGIAHARRAFAFRMPDESMDGWRRPDEMVVVDPTRIVAEGDYALVELANVSSPDAPSIYKVRQIIRRRPAEVALWQWGIKPAEQAVPRREVLSLLRVVEWPELLGA